MIRQVWLDTARGQQLAALVERCGYESMTDVLGRLEIGSSRLFAVSGEANGLLMLGLGEEAGRGRVMWIEYLVGEVAGGVKARLAAMREVLSEIEDIARQQGCIEIGGMVRRGAGWVRFAGPLGYRVVGDELRKAL